MASIRDNNVLNEWDGILDYENALLEAKLFSKMACVLAKMDEAVQLWTILVRPWTTRPPLPGFKALSIHSRPDLRCFTQLGQELSPVWSAHQGRVLTGPHLLCPRAKRRCVNN
eukprot:bmy_09594T0